MERAGAEGRDPEAPASRGQGEEEVDEIEEKIETVLKAYENGIDIPLISNITDLSEEEVVKILKKKGKL